MNKMEIKTSRGSEKLSFLEGLRVSLELRKIKKEIKSKQIMTGEGFYDKGDNECNIRISYQGTISFELNLIPSACYYIDCIYPDGHMNRTHHYRTRFF